MPYFIRTSIFVLCCLVSGWISAQGSKKYKKVELWYDEAKTQKKAEYHILTNNPSVIEGEYLLYFQNGNVSTKGQFKNNQSVGEWTYFYEGGGVKKKAVLEGDNTGEWTYFYESGGVEKKGRLEQGRKVGVWFFYFENGKKKSEGSFLNTQKQGEWTYFYESGEKKAVANYHEGRGSYKEFYLNGNQKAEGTVVDNTSEGLWKYYDTDGNLTSEGYERKGVKNGRWKYYYTSGEVSSEGSYLAGKKEEVWKNYYKSGEVSSEGEYKDGAKENSWKLYHQDGTFKAKAEFVKGEGVYEEYYEDMTLKVRGKVVDGKNEGKWEYFYEDGKKEGECVFKGDTGTYVGYYPSGRKRIEGTIENGQKTGIWKLYDKRGKITGYYKTVFDKNSKDRVLGDLMPAKQVGDSMVVDTLKPKTNIADKAVKKVKRRKYKKSNVSFHNPFSNRNGHHYGQKWFNYHGYILGINPLSIAVGTLPVSLEYFHEQKTGYELMYFYARNPFFASISSLEDELLFTTGYQIAFKQKFYFPEKHSSMIYFAHELRFLDYNYGIKVNNGGDKLKAHEFRYAYTVQFGNRILKSNRTKQGLTFDIYIGLGIGYRDFRKDYEINEENEALFEDLNQGKIYVPTRLGFTFGYLF